MNHKELDAWKDAMVLVEMVYAFTRTLPKEEDFNLKSQLRRASVSVPSNIAEGCARKSDKELVNFIYIAIGSLSEIETQLIIAQRIFGSEAEKVLSQAEKTKQILLGLIRYLKNKR